MEKFNTVKANLEKHGFIVSVFATAKEAADYLDSKIDGVTVGMGGSVTIRQLDLWEKLRRHNAVYSHGFGYPTEQDGELVYNGSPCAPDPSVEGFRKAAFAEVYISSANAVAETGEIINIDGYGNRVAGTLFGHKKVYFVVGRNKLAPDQQSALDRARNVAAPLNARRKNSNTPCVANNCERCFDCAAPDRICTSVVTLLRPSMDMETEVVLIDEDLGF